MPARTRRTLIIGAVLSLALTGPPSASAATGPVARASACYWEGFKITNRQNTTCAKARRALKYYYGGGGSSQGYRCKATARSGYRAGKCTASPTKSFRFAPR